MQKTEADFADCDEDSRAVCTRVAHNFMRLRGTDDPGNERTSEVTRGKQRMNEELPNNAKKAESERGIAEKHARRGEEKRGGPLVMSSNLDVMSHS